jgi:hypothetical protein
LVAYHLVKAEYHLFDYFYQVDTETTWFIRRWTPELWTACPHQCL